MAKLIYSLDGAFLGEFPLDKDRLTVGRRATNDIHIDNLAVSGEHAAITTIGNDSFLEDLDSTNGTVVNGKAIKKHVLQHGDLIELGKYQLKYINEAVLHSKGTSSAVDFDKTMIIRPMAKQPVTTAMREAETVAFPEPSIAEERVVDAVASTASAMPSWTRAPGMASNTAPQQEQSAALAHVQVLNGPSAGKELVLSKALTTLGKPGVQVAVITRRPQGYFVTHVEGVHHPKVNGNSVGAQAHKLSDHDVIEIAGVKMEFFYVQS